MSSMLQPEQRRIDLIVLRAVEVLGVDLRAGARVRLPESMAQQLVRRRVARYAPLTLVWPPRRARAA